AGLGEDGDNRFEPGVGGWPPLEGERGGDAEAAAQAVGQGVERRAEIACGAVDGLAEGAVEIHRSGDPGAVEWNECPLWSVEVRGPAVVQADDFEPGLAAGGRERAPFAGGTGFVVVPRGPDGLGERVGWAW